MNALSTGIRSAGLALGAVLAVVLALGSVASPSATTATRAQEAADVAVADGGSLGQILVDRDGFTLYSFTRDEPGKSNCSGGCAMTWPPATTTNASVNAPEAIKGDFSLIARDDGSMQIAYKGMPLYRFAPDTEPGQTKGQGVGGVWFVAQP
jgi:predicted lipoprotein with Yx(FWY)xxD motif